MISERCHFVGDFKGCISSEVKIPETYALKILSAKRQHSSRDFVNENVNIPCKKSTKICIALGLSRQSDVI